MAATAVEKRYLTVRDAAMYTGLSRWTLSRAEERGEINPSRVGRTIRFDRRELDAWLDSRSQK